MIFRFIVFGSFSQQLGIRACLIRVFLCVKMHDKIKFVELFHLEAYDGIFSLL